MVLCKKCQKELSRDEEGLYRKLMEMEPQEFLCIECLAQYFGCDVELLQRKIEHFRNLGCFLFQD